MSIRSLFYWRTTALCGVFLVTIGTAYFFFDEVTTDWYGSDLLNIFGIVGIVGIPLAFIGLIGWAMQLGKKARQQMAAAAFFAPSSLLLFGYLIDGMNVHGSAGPVISLMLLGTILAVVILIMAAAASLE